MKRDDVLRLIRANRDRLAAEYGVKRLRLFGSVARDEAEVGSDVDLLVEFDRPIGYFGFFALQDDLTGVLGVPVDLGTSASLKDRFRAKVLAEAMDVN